MSNERFVGRIEEQARFKALLPEVVTPPKGETLPYVLLVYGDGGIGKTELAKRLVDIAAESGQPVQPWWIDWADEAQKNPLLQGVRDFVPARTVFDVLHISALHNKWGRQFVSYNKAVQQNSEAEHQVSQALVAIPEGGFDEMDALRLASASAIAQIVRMRMPMIGHTGEELVQMFLEQGIRIGTDKARQLRAFLETQLRAKLRPDNYEHLLNLEQRLANALARGITNVANKQPLLIVLDSYEVVDRADVWLREVIRLSGPRVIWVIAGRNDLMHSRQFGNSYFKGYDQDFPRRLVGLPLPRLALADIRRYFQLSVPQRPLAGDALQVINDLSFGVPLAVVETAAVWERGATVEELRGETQETESVLSVVRAMTGRLLRYAPDDDRRALYAVALADGDVPVLEAMLRSADSAPFDLSRLLNTLARNYAFVNPGQARLHDVAQRFIREQLREPLYRRDINIQYFNEQAIAVLRTRQARLETELPTLLMRYADQTWRDCLLTRIEHACWLGKDHGLPSFFRRLVEAYAYHPETARRLIAVVSSWDEHWGEEDQAMLMHIQRDLQGDAVDAATLDILDKVAARGWLDGEDADERRAVIAYWRGAQLRAAGRADEARPHFEHAAATLAHPLLRESAELILAEMGGARAPATEHDMATEPKPTPAPAPPAAAPESAEPPRRPAPPAPATPAAAATPQVAASLPAQPAPAEPAPAVAPAEAAAPPVPRATAAAWYAVDGDASASPPQPPPAAPAAAAPDPVATLAARARHDATPTGWVQLGDAHARRNAFTDAIAAYHEALDRAGALHPPALLGLGRLYERLGLRDAARECFALVTEVETDNVQARVRLGDLDLRRGSTDTAQDHYERAFRATQSAEACRGLGDVCHVRQDWAGARRHYQRAAALGAAVPLDKLADAEYALGDHGRALRLYHDAMTDGADPDAIYERMGDVQMAMNHPEDALTSYRKAGRNRRVWRKIGRAAYSLNRYDESRHAFSAALDDADDVDARLGLARSLFRSGQLPEAAAAYERALASGADADDIQRELAAIKHRLGDLSGAEMLYRAALQRQPHDQEALAGLSAVSYVRGQTAQAADIAAYALKLGDHPVAHLIEGHIALDGRYYTRARAAYDRAMARDVNPPVARLANVLCHTGDPEDAVALYDTLPADKRTAQDWTGLGDALALLQEAGRAAEAYRRAIALDDHAVDAHLGLARASRAMGDMERSVSAYARVVALDADAPVYHELGETLLANNKPALAHRMFELGLQKYPEEVRNWVGMGETAQRLERLDQAAEAFDRAMTRLPHNHGVLAGRAAVAMSRGEWAVAAALYERLRELRAQDRPDELVALGNAYHHLDRPRRALLAFRQAAELDNNNIDALLGIGKVCQTVDEWEYAQTAYTTVLALDDGNVAAHIGLGDVMAARNEPAPAARYYRHALATLPTSRQVPVWNKLGRLLLTHNQPDEALRAFNSALNITQTAESHLGAGTAHLQLHEAHAALRAFRAAEQLSGGAVASRLGIGDACLELGQLDEAAEAYDGALALDDRHAAAQCRLGDVFLLMGRYHEAQARYDAALRLEPNHADAHRGSGDIRQERGDYAEAIIAYEQALVLQPTLAEAHAGLAAVYYALNAEVEALQAVERALALAPRSDWLELQGDVFFRMDRLADAERVYRQALEAAPDTPRLQTKLGRVQLEQGQFSSAERLLREAVRGEDSAETRTALGDLYAVFRGLPDAQVEYRLALEHAPDHVPALIGMGDTHYLLNRQTWAIEAYTNAVALDATAVRALNGLGNVYREQGELDQAIAMYRRAVAVEPTASTLGALGDVYNQLDARDDARAAYEAAIELDPQDLTSLSGLAGLYRRQGDQAQFEAYINRMRPLVYASGMNKYNRACFEAISGNVPEALRLLREALLAGDVDLDWVRGDPDLEFIRDDPRFEALLRDLVSPA